MSYLILILMLNVLLYESSWGMTCPASDQESSIRRLRSSLLCDYEKEERPVKDLKQTVNVNISLDLKHVFVEYYETEYDIHAWLITMWTDEFLIWDPDQYEGINKIHVSTEEIWTPDISLYNSDLTQVEVFETTRCIVKNTGRVLCGPHIRTSIYCKQNLKRWPYDVQNCDLNLGTWGLVDKEVNITLMEKGIYLEHFYPNNAWELQDLSAERNSLFNGTETTSFIRYTFVLRRHAALFVASIIAPAFVLAGLLLISFWMRGIICRSFVCCVALITNALFLQYVGYHVPADGDTSPDIVAYYRDMMLLALISLALGVIVERLRDGKSGHAPEWVTRVTTWIRGSGGRTGLFLLGDIEEETEVTSSTNQEDVNKTPKSRWSSFATFLNRISFIALAITHIILLASLLP